MTRGIDGLLDDLDRRETTVGPGAWPALMEALREVARGEPDDLAPLAEAWADREFHAWHERPALLLAGLRFLALGDDDHPLADEVLADAVAPDLATRLREALAAPDLVPLLRTRRVRPSAVERAIGWGLASLGFEAPHRGFALADLGCSAGLALVADLVPSTWRVGREEVSGLDFPSPARRLGLDRSPVDPADPEEARWLRACVQAGDTDRRRRLEQALEGWDRPLPTEQAPTIRAHRLGHDPTGEVLEAFEEEADLPVLAYQSMVRDHLSPEEADAHAAAMHAWLLGGSRRFWITLEPTPSDSSLAPMTSGPLALTLHLAVDGAVDARPLARTAHHPRACHPIPGVLPQLRRLWRERTAA
ncbi:MAG: DUF2332 family protein [Myxococcota bacterium]